MKRLGFSLASVLALCLGTAAGAQEHRLTFAHVLTEDTPNARAAVIFKEEVEKLGRLFMENFKKYEDQATTEVIKAGPHVCCCPKH